MTKRKKGQSGNAMLEFALASAVLLPCMMGAFQFGYTFYTYNLLESAISNGSRYGAYRTYRSLAGATDITKVKTAIQNMTVYGTTTMPVDAVPVVKGLRPSDIDVNFTLTGSGIPTAVTVSVKSYKLDSVFKKYTLTGKPKATLPYLGRYAPEESEN